MKNKALILKRLIAEATKLGLQDQTVLNATTLDEAIIALSLILSHCYNTKLEVVGEDLIVDKLFKKYAKYEGDLVEAKFPNLFGLISTEVYEIRAKAQTKATSKADKKVQEVVKTMSVVDKVKALRAEHKESGSEAPFKLGYARVSSRSQNLDRQISALTKEGCAFIFQEKESGAKADRKELDLLLSVAEAGDIIVISELTRLARSTAHLTSLMADFNERGIALKSLKESWLDTSTPTGKLMFTMLAGIAEFERDITKERQAEGIAIARAKGVKFGTKLREDADLEGAIEAYVNQDGSETVTEIAKRHKIDRTTLWRHLKKRGLLNNQQ